MLFIIFFPLLFLPHTITAQYKDLRFDRLTSDDGLSESSILYVLQDKEEFIWIGTWSGLNRYDGYNFKVYRNELNKNGTISDNVVYRLYEDNKGILWVGTLGGGLNKFDKNTERFTSYKHIPDDSNSISDNVINVISTDKEGFLWIGTKYYGLNKFDEKNNMFIHYYHNPEDTNSLSVGEVLAICEDSSGNLWIGTSNGLDRFDRKTGIFHHFKNNPIDDSSISNNVITCIYEDRAGNLWFGTNMGLNKLIYDNGKNYSFKHYYFHENELGNISSIYEDNNGFLWIGTFDKGLYILNTATEQFTNFRNDQNNPNSLLSDVIQSIFEDRNGIFWIGTARGINIYRKEKMKFTLYTISPNSREGLNFNSIYPGFEDKAGNIWMNSKDKFIIRDTSNTFRVIEYNPQVPTNYDIMLPWSYLDKSGIIWFRGGGNLMKYNPETRRLIPFHLFKSYSSIETSILSIFEDSDSLLWIGTETDLRVINKERTKITKFVHDDANPYSLNYNSIGNLNEDKKGAIWICLWNKGLDKYDKKTGRFYHYENNPLDSNSLSNNYTVGTYDDGNGNLWIKTYGGGLNKLDLSTNTFTRFTEKDGLANNCTIAMFPDNSGNLWISTNKGISKFNIKTQTFKNYDKADGLQVNEFVGMGFKTSRGEILMNNMNGLLSFYPDSIKENTHIPPVVITSFKIFDKEAVLDKSITKIDEIKLSYKENFFSFDYAALDYANPQKNQYAYKLDGVDKEWVYAGTIRTAHYTNIDPGEYVFLVKGSNNDGIWNEEGASIRIIIKPPWWQTWWFRAIAIFMLAGIFGSTVRYTTIQKYKRRLILEKERSRISKDMHDEVGSSLTKISILSELSKQNISNPDITKTNVEKISESASEVVDNISEIIWAINPKNDTLDNLLAYIREYAAELLELKNIGYNIRIPDNIPNLILSAESRRNIFLVIKEALNNIVKYAQANMVNIFAELPDSRLEITVKDNGIGFDIKDTRMFGNGLINMKKRIEDIGGEFNLDSKTGSGTEIRLSLKLGR